MAFRRLWADSGRLWDSDQGQSDMSSQGHRSGAGDLQIGHAVDRFEIFSCLLGRQSAALKASSVRSMCKNDQKRMC